MPHGRACSATENAGPARWRTTQRCFAFTHMGFQKGQRGGFGDGIEIAIGHNCRDLND